MMQEMRCIQRTDQVEETQSDHQNHETGEKKQGCVKNPWILCSIVLALIICILLPTLIHVLVKKDHHCPPCTCPDYWIGFQGKCYLFSKEQGDWNSSSHNCSNHHAELATYHNKEEKIFLMRYKGNFDHWIGQDEPLENTTTFNKRPDMKEECPYLGDIGLLTASCFTDRYWICMINIR